MHTYTHTPTHTLSLNIFKTEAVLVYANPALPFVDSSLPAT